ncbi:MAG: hypothetical protein AVDCRST_MAG87-2436 [uncultured Thermomicrobiales bacterium]|uniref:Uncharacterized protein n=1 Tax=uncultured Thermomicrobiales bacterium TaxID=1645740 RepID=A0A6J4V7L0_9BACT|nr:MAG: hypothetical protein AVDCRST_MAG87-2436 [uncultured Thermomicrobiales bacterium]
MDHGLAIAGSAEIQHFDGLSVEREPDVCDEPGVAEIDARFTNTEPVGRSPDKEKLVVLEGQVVIEHGSPLSGRNAAGSERRQAKTRPDRRKVYRAS